MTNQFIPSSIPFPSEPQPVVEQGVLPRPEIQEMMSLITKMGFFMMGASHIRYDNEHYKLSWLMGAGAKCKAVRMIYDPGLDLYELEFIRSTRDPGRNLILKRVYVEEVRPSIERETGFWLRL